MATTTTIGQIRLRDSWWCDESAKCTTELLFLHEAGRDWGKENSVNPRSTPKHETSLHPKKRKEKSQLVQEKYRPGWLPLPRATHSLSLSRSQKKERKKAPSPVWREDESSCLLWDSCHSMRCTVWLVSLPVHSRKVFSESQKTVGFFAIVATWPSLLVAPDSPQQLVVLRLSVECRARSSTFDRWSSERPHFQIPSKREREREREREEERKSEVPKEEWW